MNIYTYITYACSLINSFIYAHECVCIEIIKNKKRCEEKKARIIELEHLPCFVLQELFQRQQGSPSGQYGMNTMSSHFQSGTITKSHPSSPAKTGRVYASVAEMKRKGKVRH